MGLAGHVFQILEGQHSLQAGLCRTLSTNWPGDWLVLVQSLADVTADGSLDFGLQSWAKSSVHL